ncbi:primase-helicase family protein [Sphingomonas sp.]|uniref:primase-helicase family protein n=1 Tax=Sphingomonas sp. TaxID=28214 RepID=UPI0035BC1D18
MIQTEGTTRIGLVSDLDDVPAVAAYFRRAGAEPINFVSAKVERMVNGYPKTVGRISFAADGSVTVKDDAAAPTSEEAEAIKQAFALVEFPKLATLTAIADPPPGIDVHDPKVFICHDFAGQIALVQKRYDTQDGRKGFLTYTFWSDGRWRLMEPDTLPFFGLPGWQEHSTLFLHEGAGAAARVKRILAGEPNSSFPWLEDMKWGHHVGWLGGVHSVEGSDWDKLTSLGWKRVVIVADNDNLGIKAAVNIARKFDCEVYILQFDQRFDEGFDLGDEWPVTLFDSKGRYTGPPYRDFLRPAMRATDLLPPDPANGRDRPLAVLRPEYLDTLAYTLEPLRFISRHTPTVLRKPDEFNALASPFSHVKDTATKVLSELQCQHAGIVYLPWCDAGSVVHDGGRYFNVYERPRIVAKPGDLALWLTFLEHLFPVEAERETAADWIATLIARPDIRMRWGLLLISQTQGVGKGTLGEVLRVLLGSTNVSFPSARDITAQFNSWAFCKRLAFFAELYSGHSRDTYDALKPYVTDDTIPINKKFLSGFDIPNYMHFVICSNSDRALHIDDEDRRWFVPTLAEETKPQEFWRDFYAWLKADGPGAILTWASARVKAGRYVRTEDRPPLSQRKSAIADGSRTPGQQLAIEFAEHLVELDKRVILKVSDVRKWVALRRDFKRGDQPDLSHRFLEAQATLIGVMRKVRGITCWGDAKRVKFAGVKEALVMNFSPAPSDKWADLKEYLTDLAGVGLDEPF